jgi:hypothetical protein
MAEERRKVVVDEPGLSDEANQALTDEVRGAVGGDEVTVPRERHARRRAPHQRSGFAATLSANRLIILITFLTVLVVGAILALTTGSWWWLIVPLLVHAIATVALGAGIIHATTQVEKPDPSTVARLEDEGVADPEGRFNELVDEYGGTGAATGKRRERGAGPPMDQREA